MKHVLPELPYELTALEPVISKETIDYHYGKHLQTYITNLNNLIEGTEFENLSLEEIVKKSEGGVFNNAAQAWNHEFYFKSFSPNGGGAPKGALAEAINKQWGSFENFKKEFTSASVSLFGAGWTWLAKKPDGELIITKESNAGNPIKSGYITLFCFDVWEHAYYIDYRNRRADHIEKLWNILDWEVISARF